MPMINYKALSKLKTITVLILTTFGSDAHGLEDLLCSMISETKYIECSPKIRTDLDEISKDEVGGLAIKLFYQAIKRRTEKLKIYTNVDYKEGEKRFSNVFVPKDFAIYLNFDEIENLYTIGYRDGKFFPKKESLVNVLYHEFNHRIHFVTDDYRVTTSITLDKLYSEHREKYLWTNWIKKRRPNSTEKEQLVSDEEFYNITGKFWSDGRMQYNPINCNFFETNRAIKMGLSAKEVLQRMYHRSFSEDPQNQAKLRNIDLIATDFC